MLKAWIRKYLRNLINADKIEAELNKSILETQRLQKELAKYECVDIAAGYRGNCTIILTGIYRNKGYVQFYDLDLDEFKHFVEMFKHGAIHREATLRKIDAPYGFAESFDLRGIE